MKTKLTESKQNYLYISSALKDSYVRDGRCIPAFKNGPYKSEIFSFIDRLSRRTVPGKLPFKFEILTGIEGEATQVRIIIRCPGDWTPERFQEVALKEWRDCRAADELYLIFTNRSVDMDLEFLRSDWRGPPPTYMRTDN